MIEIDQKLRFEANDSEAVRKIDAENEDNFLKLSRNMGTQLKS